MRRHCPRCGESGYTKVGSIIAARGRVQRYQCVNPKCQKKYHDSLKLQPVPQRQAYLDIEASQLTASFGHMISWALKDRGGEVHSDYIKRRSLKEEKRIVASLIEALGEVDEVITYYGTRFDVPFVRTRALYHGLEFPGYMSMSHLDLYYVARARMRMHSNRLATVAEFLGIEGKTALKPDIWVRASFGDVEAIEYIHTHNIADVVILEEVHDRLEPFMKGVRRSV